MGGSHGSFRVELDGEHAYAVCSCGWRSEAAMNAGMAGSMWDRHVEDMAEDRS